MLETGKFNLSLMPGLTLKPRDMMAPPSGGEPKELVQVEFRAKDWVRKIEEENDDT